MQQYVDAGALAMVPAVFDWLSKSSVINGRAEQNHAKADHSGVQTCIVRMSSSVVGHG